MWSQMYILYIGCFEIHLIIFRAEAIRFIKQSVIGAWPSKTCCWLDYIFMICIIFWCPQGPLYAATGQKKPDRAFNILVSRYGLGLSWDFFTCFITARWKSQIRSLRKVITRLSSTSRMIWDIVHVCSPDGANSKFNTWIWGLFKSLTISMSNNNSDACLGECH